MSRPKSDTKAKVVKLRDLTYAQQFDPTELVKRPDFHAGSGNRTMKALERHGLVQLEWFDSPTGYYGRGCRWVVTSAGKALVEGTL